MQGLHLTADLFDCRDPGRLMTDEAALRSLCEHLAGKAGLDVVGSHFHAFPGAGGLTGVLLLAESHLAIHTWPEQRAVTLDVYVCNFQRDNSVQARSLVDALVESFGADRVDAQHLMRGRP